MERTVQNIPFLRITLALITGVITGTFLSLNLWLTIVIIIFLFICLVVINHKYTFSSVAYFGILLNTFFVFVGILTVNLYNSKPVLYTEGVFSAIVLESPVEKPKSFKSLVKIDKVFVHDSVFSTSEKVIVYFEKSNENNAPDPGDRILFSQAPAEIKPKQNPYDFDYKNYYQQKKIYRQVFLQKENWQNTGLKKFSLVCEAEKLRNKLVAIYRAQPIDSVEFEVLSALTLGYKKELDAETIKAFSASGAMHVLSVSGLHVGIIAGVLFFVFGFLKKLKGGKLIYVLLVIIVLWMYAFITGLSPSVLRATSMFSIYIIGDNINRKSNVYNSLALTAFFLILYNPSNINDIGFLLSYAALFGIVFLQPRFEKMVFIKNRVVKFFFSLLTVSIAAQITTFPLTSYFFGQFPVYFWITNLFIIPLVTILTPLGLMLLFINKLPVISVLIANILNIILKISLILLTGVERIPGSVWPVSISFFQLVIFILFILITFDLIVKFNARKLMILLSVFLVINIAFVVNTINRQKQNEIIVYSTSGIPVIHLISGKINYVVTTKDISDNESIQNSITNTVKRLGLSTPIFIGINKPYQDHLLFVNDLKIIFKDQCIFLNSDLIGTKPYPDHLILINPEVFNSGISPFKSCTVIFTDNRYQKSFSKNTAEIYQTFNDQAFYKKW